MSQSPPTFVQKCHRIDLSTQNIDKVTSFLISLRGSSHSGSYALPLLSLPESTCILVLYLPHTLKWKKTV